MGKRRLIVYGGKLSRTGGIETHLYNFCNVLSEHFDIHFIIGSLNFNREKVDELKSRGVSVYELSSSATPERQLLFYVKLFRLIKRLKNNDDVIFYSNAFQSSFIYMLQLFGKFKYWVHHHHSDFSPGLFNSYPIFYKQCFKKSSQVILCTAFQVAQFNKLALNKNVVCLPYCKMENNVPVKERKFKGVISYIGRVIVSKGIDYVLSIEKDWLFENKLECHIYGNNELEKESNWYKVLTSELSPPFYYFGEFNGEKEVSSILEKTSITLIPSVGAEGLPLVFTEAISRGVPVVGFKGGGLRDYEFFHEGVIICDPSLDNLKKGIIRMKNRIEESPSLSSDLKNKYDSALNSNITVKWWLHHFT